jgi:hypothetical protein
MAEDYIRPTPRNPYVGAASDATKGLRGYLNKATVPDFVPLVGGMGAGELLVGQAPEEINNWSYGNHPFKDQNVPGYAGVRGIPELRPSRTSGVADALFLGADATGVGLGLRALGGAGARSAKQGFNNAVNAGQDTGRRDFIKKAGIVGAGTAAAAATPKVLKSVVKALAPDPTTAATRVAKNALGGIPEYYRAMRKIGDNFPLGDFTAALQKTDPEYIYFNRAHKAKMKEADMNAGDFSPGDDMSDEYWALDARNDELVAMAQDSVRKEQADAMDILRKENPDFADLPDVDTIHGSRAEDLPKDFFKRTGALPDDNAVAKHLRGGGEYTDPISGNKAHLIDKTDWKPKPGHRGTRFDIEWESPNGMISPYQHWLPDYVGDEAIGTMHGSGQLKSKGPSREFPF